jgi:Na+/melibiose symporter-like transporter
VTKLALIYGPAVLLVVVWGIAIVRGYRLSPERHAEIQRLLAERRAPAGQQHAPQAAALAPREAS